MCSARSSASVHADHNVDVTQAVLTVFRRREREAAAERRWNECIIVAVE